MVRPPMIKTAVILAAGKGEKAWPYGETRAKAVFPVINTPIVSLQVRYLRELGVEKFIVVV
ncbi:MAG: sugar phosphate nucleotidyltransferase, partial [Candidatus Thorarchaeota archaeon]